jgi:hypothetical protein
MAGVILILPFVVGFVIYFMIIIGRRWPGMMLQRRFNRLETPVGRSLDEITQLVGPPQAATREDGGSTLYQWITSSFHIALLFQSDHCVEVVRVVRE